MISFTSSARAGSGRRGQTLCWLHPPSSAHGAGRMGVAECSCALEYRLMLWLGGRAATGGGSLLLGRSL